MRLIRCPFFYVLILAALPAIGQVQLDRFVYRQPDTAWRPELLAYVRNTEFFHPAEEGRTRFGALAGMRRRFDVAPGQSAELGGFVHQEFGAMPRFVPWIRLEYRHSKVMIAFGSIRDRSHGLPRQLINPDLRYAVPVVYGLEGSAIKNHWIAHYWVEWLQAIDYGSPFKERIHGGVTAGFAAEWLEIKGLLQYHHVGGQIDASPDSDGNRLNYGAFAQVHLGSSWWLRAAQLYYADPLAAFSPESAGRGTSVEGVWRMSKRLAAEASYWDGRNFQAPLGQGLFQSRNPEAPLAWHAQDRQMLGFGLAWEGASSLRVRGWYDLDDRRLQPSVTWVKCVVLDPVSGTKHRKGLAQQ
ncbi:MAG: hypothetical protein RL608_58 [Bacteroidota bacterium]|jgi:hypothetical protein